MLHVDVDGKLDQAVNDVIGKTIAIIGNSGSGKSNNAAVHAEEFAENRLPFTVIDLEGEFWGLREKYPLLIAGQSENVDIQVGVADAGALAKFSYDNKLSVVLDLSDMTTALRDEFLLAYLEQIWECAKQRRPYHLIIDEAHELVPQMANSPLKEIIKKVALRGRKKGLAAIVISQRAANIDKNILTQANILYLHRTKYPTDLGLYQDIVPTWERKQTKQTAFALQKGQAIVVLNDDVQLCQIRERHTYHGGATPTLDDDAAGIVPEMKRIDDSLLEQLRGLMGRATSPLAPPPVEGGESRRDDVAELQRQIAEKDGEIQRLREIVDKMPAEQPQQLSMPMPAVESTSEDYQLHPRIINMAKNKQEKAFIRLLDELRGMSELHRNMLFLMMGHEEVAKFATYDLEHMARKLGQRLGTVEKKPPTALVNLGLFHRQGSRGAYRYRAKVREYVTAQYPDLNPDELIQRIKLVLGIKEAVNK